MDLIKILIIVLVVLVVVLALLWLGFNAAYQRDLRKADKGCLWCDRKRNALGLPWSFTKYSLTEDRLFVQRGLLKTQYDEVRLYRVLDVNVSRTLLQRISSVGTIVVHSSDMTLGCFSLQNIKDPLRVKELLSDHVETQRDLHRVYSRETMIDMPDDAVDHHGHM